ncbi:hypothetical protein CKM354_001216800 [Cercospora kikuchii]|uniref:Ubiquitin-like domain-containing protein n=1 Tax=Cercospora kikuchii TaxID=84275 RepID=A0A9P3FLG6_9PEZI|nr:uncharacterized protein CKM354_001216800 [Cercospora kikuchii]GIZ49131.1 hypothetical protein CKM354_001216800 [Cercospora kikuchii]
MSFFKAPSWAKTQTKADSDDEDDDQDLFSHSKNFMAIQRDRLEQEKRKKERAKQKEEEKAQRRKDKAAKTDSKSGVKRESLERNSKDEPVKKRRINSEESAKLLASVGIKPVTIDSDTEDEQIVYEPEDSLPVRRSPRSKRTRDALARSRGRSALDSTTRAEQDAETESEVEIVKSTTKPAPVVEEEEEEEDSDPEIAALQRMAREKHRLKKQQEELRSATPGAGNSEGDNLSGLPTPPPPDPIISLFITTDIPDAVELLVKRKMSQDLGTVRRAWCGKQGFPQDFSDKVFFTWNGIRMYDFTTCKRLGLEVDSEGNVVRADQRDADGAAQVHVVATTQELLDKQKAEKLRQAKAESAQYEPEVETEAAAEEEQQQKAEVKIIVRAKDQRPVHVKVFSTTKISKIINYAKKQMGVSADQPAYLSFDGDRLDPDDVVGNTEMEDLENVDLVLGE